MFPVKKRSGRPSLLKSDTATPPPLKMYSLVRILKLSVSVMVFSKSIPLYSESSRSNNVDCSLLQETNNTPERVKNIKTL